MRDRWVEGHGEWRAGEGGTGGLGLSTSSGSRSLSPGQHVPTLLHMVLAEPTQTQTHMHDTATISQTHILSFNLFYLCL